MITLFQAAILGLLQGITELFPISSLGHSIILPAVLGWHLNMNATAMVEFLVATHFATALVLFLVYWKDWVRIIKGIFRSFAAREIAATDTDAKLGWLLVTATIPAGVIGIIFEAQAKQFFTSPRQAAFFLMVNGVLLFAAELLRRRYSRNERGGRGANTTQAVSAEILTGADERIAKLSWWQAVKVGCMQVLALIPGISRTGSTMTGGLFIGLSHEDALRFSFLLATPIIGAAALLELPGLFAAGGAVLTAAAVGAIAAAAAAYCAVKLLVRHFKTRTLIPFALYCLCAGAVALLLIR